ncbi:hypothetical protein CC86DRAFT_449204 [Ophiobolus disseminans]|uniref:Uncharacterized protein n=1 Tax=Ophiobolus disseminans TaxID=1469910 RepID=A0A6A6ZIL1_9PLEO|nr:hypothetical protein CC86DRAFT_449204 [Ophiobolus disseminans]
MEEAASWLKDTFLDFFMGTELPESPPPTSIERRAGEDERGRGQGKCKSDEAYRNAPYGTAGPSRPRPHPRQGSGKPAEDSVETIRARRSLEDLKRHLSSEPNQMVLDAIEPLEGQLDIRSQPSKPVGRLTLTGRPQSLEDLNFSGENLGADWQPLDYVQPAVGRTPRPQTSTKKANLPKTIKPSTTIKAATPLKSWKPGMNRDEMWSTHPNKRAREMLNERPRNVKQFIQAEIEEPEYTLRDVEIRDGLWHMMDLMERFTKKFFQSDISTRNREPWVQGLFEELKPETAKIIGCVASGGPGGVQGWKDLFLDNQKKRALVMAIIGNVLVEQVFQHIFFGGIVKHINKLAEIQQKHKKEDGFDRNKHYANAMRKSLKLGTSNTFILPSNFTNHVTYITSVIWTHIRPIFAPSSPLHNPTPSAPIAQLADIVALAGLLSLSMRLDPHTVYYFEPVFKEDTLTAKRMECFNHKNMAQRNPRIPDDEPRPDKEERVRRAKLSEDEKKRSKLDEPLTQITIMDGVTAYRLGGWEAPESTIGDVVYEKYDFANKGVRSRILTHGWVYCRWGRARRFKEGKPADMPAAHGEAWKGGGFKEFTDCEGVVDWLGSARVEEEDLQEQLLDVSMSEGESEEWLI